MADSVNHPITLSILAALGHPDMEVAELAYTESLGTSGLREATVDITTDGAEPPLDIHATHERFFVASVEMFGEHCQTTLMLKPPPGL